MAYWFWSDDDEPPTPRRRRTDRWWWRCWVALILAATHGYGIVLALYYWPANWPPHRGC